ncbi:MAG: hypothetical protein ABIU86_14720 [Gemmatimonadaceae bacterium]
MTFKGRVCGGARHSLLSAQQACGNFPAILLESYAAALAASVPIGILMLRIVLEEGLLRQKLEGYDDYTTKVRWRLIPGLW